MRLPISPQGAAVGVMVIMACFTARLTAGVVAPPASEPSVSIEPSSPAAPVVDAAVATSLPLPAASEPQPFWFPGADDGAMADVSLSSVPVRAHEIQGAQSILLGTHQHPLIPLPASAWTGLAGLLGLGAVKVLRNFRKLLA